MGFSSKNAGRVSKGRKDTEEKKERKPKEGAGYSRLPFFFFAFLSLSLPLSVPRRYRQRSALWKFLAGSPLLFSLCYRIMLVRRSQERRRKEKKWWSQIWSRKEFVHPLANPPSDIYLLFVHSLTSRFSGNLIIPSE